jgi:hypothetical protein
VSQTRVVVAAVVLVLFIVAGGVLIYFTRSHGGQNVTLNVKVTGGKVMQPDTLTVHQNDMVTINVTSDTDGEVHLHVYDIAFDTKAGQTVSHTFKADKAESCEIEWESTSTHLGSLVVSP